ncbi:MAG: hypothetical protein JO277_00825 [Candidatus Eremiobacteraeota bacterium]|nr:hypothetical protein [Candidatus Eremiobacteraeota bacterium]
MARHRFRGFGSADDRAHIAGPLIGGGATQIGIMLAHLHAKKNPAALRHAGIHGAILGALVSGGLAMTQKYRAIGISALVTVGVMALPRILEGFMGLGHRDETMKGYELGIITPEQYQSLSDSEPAIQLLDAGGGSTGVLGTQVAEEVHPLAGAGGAGDYVEMMGSGFGTNFLAAQ